MWPRFFLLPRRLPAAKAFAKKGRVSLPNLIPEHPENLPIQWCEFDKLVGRIDQFESGYCKMKTGQRDRVIGNRVFVILVLSVTASLHAPAVGLAADTEPPEYTPVRATTRLADGPRTLGYAPGYGRKFSSEVTPPLVTLTNPYLDPTNVPFLSIAAMQCSADGGLIISGDADGDADARPRATGFWRTASDGALIPLHVRGLRPSRAKTSRTLCEAPYDRTNLGAAAFFLASDGTLHLGTTASIVHIGRDKYARRIAGLRKRQ